MTDFDVVREPLLYMLNGVPGRGLTEVELRPMLAALARIGAENERATKRAGELMAEVERLRADNAEHLKANTATAKGLHRAQEEVSRLRRIEEAARVFGGIWDAIDATADDPDAPGVSWNVVEASLSALRSALKEKP